MDPRRSSTRRVRAFALALASFLLVTPIAPAPPRRDEGPAISWLRAEPVALDENDPGRRRVGQLLFLRGWNLDSGDRRFGGLSAMQIEGGQVTAISDSGVLLRFALPRRPGRSPIHVRALLPEVEAKSGQDSEALVLAGNSAWIAFERTNGLIRFVRPDWRIEARTRPRAMRGWRGNNGPEGLVRLGDGRFLVFAEARTGSRFSRVLLFLGDPATEGTPTRVMRFRRPAGFRLTDATLLPDGRLLLLCRRFRPLEGPSASLVLASLPPLREGAVIEGREIARLGWPLTVDNMEAVSATRESGRTIVRIASDDNFLRLQRTLLLEFALIEPVRRAARRP